MYLFSMKIIREFWHTRWSCFRPALYFNINMTRTNCQFLIASVNEFISVWLGGGEACLNLTTSHGIAKVGFNCTLGLPGASHSHPPPPSSSPPPPPHQPRHRGPSQRERNRQRAALHQAAQKLAAGPASTNCIIPFLHWFSGHQYFIIRDIRNFFIS